MLGAAKALWHDEATFAFYGRVVKQLPPGTPPSNAARPRARARTPFGGALGTPRDALTDAFLRPLRRRQAFLSDRADDILDPPVPSAASS